MLVSGSVHPRIDRGCSIFSRLIIVFELSLGVWQYVQRGAHNRKYSWRREQGILFISCRLSFLKRGLPNGLSFLEACLSTIHTYMYTTRADAFQKDATGTHSRIFRRRYSFRRACMRLPSYAPICFFSFPL